MRGIGLLLAAALTLGSLPGCIATEIRTEFRVYDLNELVGHELDANEEKVFVSMIRDAVGQDAWFTTDSTIHVLDGVLTVRTTTDGHEELGRFFGRFRVINNQR